MHRVRRILVTMGLVLLWVLVVVAVVFVEAFWFAAPAVTRGDVASIEQHLVQEISEAAASRRLGSASLVLKQGGKIVAEHGFGVANAETGAPVKTDQTLFRVASVSKAVTAWGILKLVEDGKLSLDEPTCCDSGSRTGNGDGLFERWLHNSPTLNRRSNQPAICRLHEGRRFAAIGNDEIEF